MPCKFCNEQRAFVSAHIIPKSLYPFDEGNERAPLVLVVPNKSDKIPLQYVKSRSPSGIYDENLLCANCESRFAPWDDAAHRLFNDDERWKVAAKRGAEPLLFIADGDYTRIKLFFISLLWRAHATAHPMFQHVKLGHWAEKAKRHILENDPGSMHDFSVLLVRFADPQFKGVILDPRPERLLERRSYRFYIGKYAAHIKVDQRAARDPFSDFCLAPDRQVAAIARIFEDGPEMRLLKSVARKMRKPAVKVG